MAEFEIKIKNGKASIYTPYNKSFVDKVKLMGAKWDASDRCWVVPEYIADDVRKVMRDVYGRDDNPVVETVDVVVYFDKTVCGYRAPVEIMGRTLASAYGRDSGAKVGDDAMFLQGAPRSGGSVNYWTTEIPSGSVVKLCKVPKDAADNAKLPEGVRAEYSNQAIDRAALEAEKEKLIERIKEIEKMLETIG